MKIIEVKSTNIESIKTAQAEKKIMVEIYTWVDKEGNMHTEYVVPDQGIKYGCDELKKVLGGGNMDHSKSSDYPKEKKTEDSNFDQLAPPDTSLGYEM